jgi:tetratricopeptide (TPR) repeat protein
MAKSNLLRKQERPKQVDIGLENNATLSPEARKLVRKGHILYKKGDLPNAAKFLVAAWNMAPKNVDLLITVAHILARLGVRHKALEVLEQAIAINGPQPEVLAVVGDMALEMNMFDVAEKVFRIYIQQRPAEAVGYNNLATAIGRQDRRDEAITLLSEIIPLFPESHLLWNTLGTFVAGRDGYKTALPFYQESYRIEPNNFALLNNLALATANLGLYDLSIDWGRKAIKADPDGYFAHMGLGTSLLATGELKEGWNEYEWRQHARRHGAIHYTHGLKRWDGSSLEGKRLLIAPEQGLGDEILFSLNYPLLSAQAKQLYIGCDARLAPLYQRSFPEAKISPYIDRYDDAYRYRSMPYIQGEAREGFTPADVAVECGSLPKFMWQKVEDIPHYEEGHLKPDPDRVEFWKKRLAALGPNLKVGMSWRSGIRDVDRNKMYTLIEQWGPIFALKGVDFINLQYDECAAERQMAKDMFGVTIHDWDDLDLKNNLDDTAALTKCLDLVIGPTSTPGTIAFSVGVEVWWLVRFFPWWSFGTKGAPFSPKSSFTIATLEEKWEDIMPQVADRLAARIAAQNAAQNAESIRKNS